ncbi:hypothetical protein LTR73_008721 [Friedmanniomyces endolithicus]|nr:hypothetical protein LTR73_008721 [Friedmanniomyces endolithicus]
MRALAYRASLTVINIFFPPLAVAMLCGWEWDCMLNCVLFLLAVIPSHVHGFYISCTYFHRRKKVRWKRPAALKGKAELTAHQVKKGRWPGGPKSLIHSDNVINGGASDAEAARLWRKENGLEEKHDWRSRHNGVKRIDSQRPSLAQQQGSILGRVASRRDETYESGVRHRQGSQLERTDAERTRRSNRRPDGSTTATEAHMACDGYGRTLEQRAQSVNRSAIGCKLLGGNDGVRRTIALLLPSMDTMFDDNFTFDTARSPSLDSSNAPTTRDTSRSVSPCSTVPPFPGSRFSVTDLAAQLADQRNRTDSRIRYDDCEAYAANDDDAGWTVMPSIERDAGIAPLRHSSTSTRQSSRPHSPSQRSQRQANARLLFTHSHRQDIAALVARMVQSKEQCSVSSSESLALTTTITEDEGYDSSDGSTAVHSRRSSVASARRVESRRASDVKSSGACVSKSIRFRRNKPLSRARTYERS